MLTTVLVVAAFLAGLTGTWSPCGFSMIESLRGRRVDVAAACVTFALGAVAGGVSTFGLVAAAGVGLHALGAGWIVSIVPVLVVAAAIADLRGLPLAPQIRRQVPEPWRRTLPLPLAAGLYGLLLGLAFTTFVLAFAVWALAAVVLALGMLGTGVAVGVAFGVGRALPVVLVAPFSRSRLGVRVVATMAERPAILRAFRVADAFALLVAAVLLVVSTAGAATRLGDGTDPSAAGGLVTWTTVTGGVEMREGQSGTTAVPAHASVGGSLIAWRDGDLVHVAHAADMAPVLDVTVPGVDALAVSDTWLVTRARSNGGDTLTARQLASPDDALPVASVTGTAQLGRPALDGDLLVYHVATSVDSRIVERGLSTSTSRVLRRSKRALLSNPAVLDGRILYVRQTSLAQLLELGSLTGHDRVLYRLGAPARHDAGHERGYSHETRTPHPRIASWTMWTTALSSARAYVTLLPRRKGALPRIVSVAR